MDRTLFIVLVLSAVAALPATARGSSASAEVNHSWDALTHTVRNGETISVRLTNGTSVKGKLLAIDTSSISIEHDGRPLVVEAADVVRVAYAGVRKRHVKCGVLAAMVGAAIATVVIDQQSSHPSSVAEAAGMGAVFIGIPIGAIGGALAPIGPALYEARGSR